MQSSICFCEPSDSPAVFTVRIAGMLSLETRSRSRDRSRPHFHGLGLGLGLVGPGLGLGLVGSGLGLGLDLVGPGLGPRLETETEIFSKQCTNKKCRPTSIVLQQQ